MYISCIVWACIAPVHIAHALFYDRSILNRFMNSLINKDFWPAALYCVCNLLHLSLHWNYRTKVKWRRLFCFYFVLSFRFVNLTFRTLFASDSLCVILQIKLFSLLKFNLSLISQFFFYLCSAYYMRRLKMWTSLRRLCKQSGEHEPKRKNSRGENQPKWEWKGKIILRCRLKWSKTGREWIEIELNIPSHRKNLFHLLHFLEID